jgi:hypothetical protein
VGRGVPEPFPGIEVNLACDALCHLSVMPRSSVSSDVEGLQSADNRIFSDR